MNGIFSSSNARFLQKDDPDGNGKVPARKEESEKAMETMRRIEKDKDLYGFMALKDETK